MYNNICESIEYRDMLNTIDIQMHEKQGLLSKVNILRVIFFTANFDIEVVYHNPNN